MSCLRNSRFVVVGLCASLAAPARLQSAENTKASRVPDAQTAASAAIPDIALGDGGVLEGQVVDDRGAPLAATAVIISQETRETARTTTTKDGRFSVAGLQGGFYQISTQRGSGTYRLWTQEAAPPAARQMATLVAEPQVTRGQMPLSHCFQTKSFLIGAIIAAAIAIPIAVHNSSDDDDSGS